MSHPQDVEGTGGGTSPGHVEEPGRQAGHRRGGALHPQPRRDRVGENRLGKRTERDLGFQTTGETRTEPWEVWEQRGVDEESETDRRGNFGCVGLPQLHCSPTHTERPTCCRERTGKRRDVF